VIVKLVVMKKQLRSLHKEYVSIIIHRTAITFNTHI